VDISFNPLTCRENKEEDYRCLEEVEACIEDQLKKGCPVAGGSSFSSLGLFKEWPKSLLSPTFPSEINSTVFACTHF
jgi:hypothetical protein